MRFHWEVIEWRGRLSTDRMAIPGGWLVRCYKNPGSSVPTDAVAICYVPGASDWGKRPVTDPEEEEEEQA